MSEICTAQHSTAQHSTACLESAQHSTATNTNTPGASKFHDVTPPVSSSRKQRELTGKPCNSCWCDTPQSKAWPSQHNQSSRTWLLQCYPPTPEVHLCPPSDEQSCPTAWAQTASKLLWLLCHCCPLCSFHQLPHPCCGPVRPNSCFRQLLPIL